MFWNGVLIFCSALIILITIIAIIIPAIKSGYLRGVVLFILLIFAGIGIVFSNSPVLHTCYLAVLFLVVLKTRNSNPEIVFDYSYDVTNQIFKVRNVNVVEGKQNFWSLGFSRRVPVFVFSLNDVSWFTLFIAIHVGRLFFA